MKIIYKVAILVSLVSCGPDQKEKSSEELEPTIAKAEEERGKEEKKYDAEIKKIGDENTKTQEEEAKKADNELKEEMKKAQPKPLKPSSLVQKKSKKVISLKKVP